MTELLLWKILKTNFLMIAILILFIIAMAEMDFDNMPVFNSIILIGFLNILSIIFCISALIWI